MPGLLMCGRCRGRVAFGLRRGLTCQIGNLANCHGFENRANHVQEARLELLKVLQQLCALERAS